MFQTERNRDEVVVKPVNPFTISGGQLVLTLTEARKLSEALLDATMIVALDLEEEDG